MAKDQEGSRFIQQRLECAVEDEVQLVFDESIAAIEGALQCGEANHAISTERFLSFHTPHCFISLAW
jgi:hypothetical protein